MSPPPAGAGAGGGLAGIVRHVAIVRQHPAHGRGALRTEVSLRGGPGGGQPGGGGPSGGKSGQVRQTGGLYWADMSQSTMIRGLIRALLRDSAERVLLREGWGQILPLRNSRGSDRGKGGDQAIESSQRVLLNGNILFKGSGQGQNQVKKVTK